MSDARAVHDAGVLDERRTLAGRAAPRVALLAALALFGAADLTLVESIQSLIVLAAALWAAWRLSSTPLARLAAALFLVGAVLFGAPAFQLASRAIVDGPFEWWFLSRSAALFGAAVWLGAAHRRTAAEAAPSPDARLEALFAAPRSRASLAAAAFLAGAATLYLQGAGLRAGLAGALLLGACAWALPALVGVARDAAGARRIRHFTLALLGFFALSGAIRFGLAYRTLVAEHPVAAAGRVEAFNATLRSDFLAARVEALRGQAAAGEGDFAAAEGYYRRAAEREGRDPHLDPYAAECACWQGRSESAWRCLIAGGFEALRDPRLAAGMEELLLRDEQNLRVQVLLALWQWDRGAPEPARRARLAKIQKLLPVELTSAVLLGRMGTAMKGAFVLPGALFFAPAGRDDGASEVAPLDEGEATALAVLDAGTWKATLRAAGAPAGGAAPLLRVELGGETVARLTIDRADMSGYEFELPVARGDIYRLRLVFENGAPFVENGVEQRRRLAVSDLRLQRVGDGK
ncbi:MAG: hypothetical protein L6R28_07915 [Planctomycetes bacterium]|nr:hypothetical protein [Planctomycetota bacterium]